MSGTHGSQARQRHAFGGGHNDTCLFVARTRLLKDARAIRMVAEKPYCTSIPRVEVFHSTILVLVERERNSIRGNGIGDGQTLTTAWAPSPA